MIRTATIISLFICCLIDSAQVAAEPTPFRAVYKADYKGLPVSAVGIRELKKVEGGIYQLSSTAKSFFASVSEKSILRSTISTLYPLNITINEQE